MERSLGVTNRGSREKTRVIPTVGLLLRHDKNVSVFLLRVPRFAWFYTVTKGPFLVGFKGKPAGTPPFLGVEVSYKRTPPPSHGQSTGQPASASDQVFGWLSFSCGGKRKETHTGPTDVGQVLK